MTLKKLLRVSFPGKLINLPVLVILCLVLPLVVLRFSFLGHFPAGLNHDEAEVIISAKSYWKYFTDSSLVPFPQSLLSNNTNAKLSGLPSLLLSPFIGPFYFNLTYTRLIFVGVNLFTILLLGAIVWQYTKNQKLSLIVILVSLINPWLFAYARTTTETPFALLFTLAGIYGLTKYKDSKVYLSLVFFLAAFFSYFGAKPIIILFVPILLFINNKFPPKLNWKTNMSFIMIFFAFTVGYFALTSFGKNSTFQSRATNELAFINLDRFSNEVDYARKTSLEFFGKELFNNKDTFLLREISYKYLGFLSLDYLIKGGDTSATYRFGEHGMVYIADFFFVIFGFLGMGIFWKNAKYRKLFLIVIFLLVIAPLGSGMDRVDTTYFFRSFLLIPSFIIIISLGIYTFLELLKKQKMPIIAIVFVYGILFINFIYFYFFRFSLVQQENNFLGERVAVELIKRSSKNINVIVKSPSDFYYQYLFFTNSLEKEDLLSPKQNSYKVENALITSDCEYTKTDTTVIVQKSKDCVGIAKGNSLKIQDQKDTGTIFEILNGDLCNNYNLTLWRRSHLIRDYEFTKMTDEEFCIRWINK